MCIRDRHILSSLNYQKNWINSNNSLTINLSDSYNLLQEDEELVEDQVLFHRSFMLPSLSFTHGSRLLFGDGMKWYNSIYYSISSSSKFSIQEGRYGVEALTPMPNGYTCCPDQEIFRNNFLGEYYIDDIDTLLYKNGTNHRVSLTAPQK